MAEQKKVRASLYLKWWQQLDVVNSADEIQKAIASHKWHIFIKLEWSFRSQEWLATAPVNILLSEISGVIDLENMAKIEVKETKEKDIKNIQDKVQKKINKYRNKK